MLRVDLDRQLNHLQEEVLLLANVVDKAVMRAVEALKSRIWWNLSWWLTETTT